jgi:hypothetical protein
MHLVLKFTRISPTHHTLEYVREDGSRESAEMETKTFLEHDFLHYAIESEARISTGFFGLLGRGYNFSQLNLKSPSDFDVPESHHVERAVGVFTGMIKGNLSEEDAMRGVKNFYDAEGRAIPSWITADLFVRAKEKYRQIYGKWNSLPFGKTLELIFEYEK